jgi:Kelch motif
MGGFDGYGPMSSIEKADLSKDNPTFVELPRENSLASPLKNSVNVLFDGRVYLIGGWDNRDTSDSIYIFDPKTETCYFAGKIPSRIEGHSVIVLGENAFIIGGFDSFGVSDRIIKLNLKTL